MKNIIILYTIVIGAFFSQACKNESKTTETKVVIALYDLSASVDETSLKNYQALSESLLKKLNDGDKYLGFKISDKSLTERNAICNLTIPIFEPSTTNSIIKNKEQQDHQASKTKLIDDTKQQIISALFEDHKSVQQTDILAALQRAAQEFKNSPTANKYLIIYSDMIESESSVNFEQKLPDATFCKNLIEKQRQNKILPDFKGVSVFVEGANAPNNNSYNAIKQFWIDYLKACGATLEEQNYAAHLNNINGL